MSRHGQVVQREGEFEHDVSILLKAIVAKDSQTKAVFCHVVSSNWVAEDKSTVDCFVEVQTWLGHSHVILKCDNENTMLKAILEDMRITVTDEDRECRPPR